MGGYIVVLLTALVCLAPTSSSQNAESREPCRLKGKGSSNLSNGEKEQGTFLQWNYVECMLISQESGAKLTFDINRALHAAEVHNNTLVGVSVTFSCPSSIELDFINEQNTDNKNILLVLLFQGACKVWARNLVAFTKSTDFRTMRLIGKNTTWSSVYTLTNLTHGSESFVRDFRDITVITAHNSLPENIPGMFTDTRNVWPNMAEIYFEDTPIKEIPEQWKITMPRLQGLLLVKCNLTEPPEFPWNNSTLELVRELRRTDDSEQVFQVEL